MNGDGGSAGIDVVGTTGAVVREERRESGNMTRLDGHFRYVCTVFFFPFP